MRIDDSNSLPYTKMNNTKRAQTKTPKDTQNESTAQAAGADPEMGGQQSRADRIEQLKQSYSQGNPVNVGKLADQLLKQGIFFDQKA